MESDSAPRYATPEEVEGMLRHSPSGVVLAPVSSYPGLRLEPVTRAYLIDEVNIEIAQTDLPAPLPVAAALRPSKRSISSAMPSNTPVRSTRGVTHIRPRRVISGAWAFLLSWLAILGTLIGLPLWMVFSQSGAASLWMFAPVALLLLTLIWAFNAVPKARCTVCMQPMFSNLKCLKNERAHRFALGSTALSSALVAAFTMRLRCPYCGTRQHLHGRKDH